MTARIRIAVPAAPRLFDGRSLLVYRGTVMRQFAAPVTLPI